jgi:hypothetical protein
MGFHVMAAGCGAMVYRGGQGPVHYRPNQRRQADPFDRAMQLMEFAQQWGTPKDVAEAAEAADAILGRLEREPLHRQIADRLLADPKRPAPGPRKNGEGPTDNQTS